MGIVRRKRGAGGRWRSHELDARQALQLLACGMVLGARLVSRDCADRFVAEGFAAKHTGLYALTGRGVLATLASPAVWAEARSQRRLARQFPTMWRRCPRWYPLVAPRAWLDEAVGRPVDPANLTSLADELVRRDVPAVRAVAPPAQAWRPGAAMPPIGGQGPAPGPRRASFRGAGTGN